jgi:YegS/Rv2252/BmrU family lipid kinase
MHEPWQLIFNPAAGGGRAGRSRATLLEHLRQYGIAINVHDTEGPGDAEAFTRDARTAGRTRYLVAGGDGTVNEVINGLFNDGVRDPPPLVAAVPLGSGNDWARSRGLHIGLARIVEKLIAPRCMPCAVGRVRGFRDGRPWQRYFGNSVGIGLDVCVLQHLPPWRIAAVRYAVALLRAFATFPAREVCVRADGSERRGVALLNLCALGAYSGGGMRLAPHAAAQPGKLAVTWVDDASWLRLLACGHKLYDGTLGELPEVALYHADNVEFAAPTGEPLQADGEIIGATPASVEILPAALLTLADDG